MEYTYNKLKHMNVNQLRDIAVKLEDEAVQGYTQMNKDHLLEALCNAMNIDMFVHHRARGINKTAIKQEIRTLRAERDEALAAKDHETASVARKRIHDLKRQLRKAMV